MISIQPRRCTRMLISAISHAAAALMMSHNALSWPRPARSTDWMKRTNCTGDAFLRGASATISTFHEAYLILVKQWANMKAISKWHLSEAPNIDEPLNNGGRHMWWTTQRLNMNEEIKELIWFCQATINGLNTVYLFSINITMKQIYWY